MTFGNALYMGVPWEVIIGDYSRRLGDRRFETLREYFDNFVEFLEGAEGMFPPATQDAELRRHVADMWSVLYAAPLKKISKLKRRVRAGKIDAALHEIIQADHPHWEDHACLINIDDTFAQCLLASRESMLNDVEREVFDQACLSNETSAGLRTTLRYFLTRRWNRSDDTNVVIAGFGESEFFPSLLNYQVGPIIGGRVRRTKDIDDSIGPECAAHIFPFAQRNSIDMVIDGIHPRVMSKIIELIEAEGEHSKRLKRPKTAEAEPLLVAFERGLRTEMAASQSAPFMTAVAGLPRQDLGELAASLVNFAIFRAKMSIDAQETLRGPVDVAVISKGDGFTWIRRKSLGPITEG